MNLLNVGCGVVRPVGWVNADILPYSAEPSVEHLDLTDRRSVDSLTSRLGPFDAVVANHVIHQWDHWDLQRHILPNLRALLRPKTGVLRILVPDLIAAVRAWTMDDVGHFPLGDDLPGIDERLCTFITWFGECRSVFSPRYLEGLLDKAGFTEIVEVGHGWSGIGLVQSAALDDREGHSFVMEARA